MKKIKKIKKIILNPLFSPILICMALLCIGIIGYTQYVGGNPSFFEPNNVCDMLTYALYGIAFIVAVSCVKAFNRNKLSYGHFLFLWLCAVLREMGVQHWIPSKDTTAFKIRFFTNPENPIIEKLFSGFILLTVASIGIYLILKYVPQIWKGFWNKEPLYWTICTLGVIGVVSKFADRFPSNYFKSTGYYLSFETSFWFSLIEEGGEAMLPLLFAVAIGQYYLLKQKD